MIKNVRLSDWNIYKTKRKKYTFLFNFFSIKLRCHTCKYAPFGHNVFRPF